MSSASMSSQAYGTPTTGAVNPNSMFPSGMPQLPSLPGVAPTGPNTPQQGGTMTYNGTQMSYQNPGLMSPSGLNPAAAAYASQLQGLGQQIQGATPGSAYYQGMANTQGAAIQSSIGNQMAGMGLSGSSAAAGAMTQAGIQNNQAWTQKQFQDTMASAQAQGQLNQAGYGQTMGIQNQYGEFEDAYNQSIANLLGAQQQSSEAATSAWTGGISALLGGGGTAAGGIFHGAGA